MQFANMGGRSLPNGPPLYDQPAAVELTSIGSCLTVVWSVAAFTEQPVTMPIKSCDCRIQVPRLCVVVRTRIPWLPGLGL